MIFLLLLGKWRGIPSSWIQFNFWLIMVMSEAFGYKIAIQNLSQEVNLVKLVNFESQENENLKRNKLLEAQQLE